MHSHIYWFLHTECVMQHFRCFKVAQRHSVYNNNSKEKCNSTNNSNKILNADSFAATSSIQPLTVMRLMSKYVNTKSIFTFFSVCGNICCHFDLICYTIMQHYRHVSFL